MLEGGTRMLARPRAAAASRGEEVLGYLPWSAVLRNDEWVPARKRDACKSKAPDCGLIADGSRGNRRVTAARDRAGIPFAYTVPSSPDCTG